MKTKHFNLEAAMAGAKLVTREAAEQHARAIILAGGGEV